MPQARVVLRDAVLEKAEKLQEVTQVGSISELISVMFSRYGSHLEQTWEVKATSPTYAQPEPSPELNKFIRLKIHQKSTTPPATDDHCQHRLDNPTPL